MTEAIDYNGLTRDIRGAVDARLRDILGVRFDHTYDSDFEGPRDNNAREIRVELHCRQEMRLTLAMLLQLSVEFGTISIVIETEPADFWALGGGNHATAQIVIRGATR